jgi:hypothetical protein
MKRGFDSVRLATAISFLFNGKKISAWGGPGKSTVAMDGSQWIPYQEATFPNKFLWNRDLLDCSSALTKYNRYMSDDPTINEREEQLRMMREWFLNHFQDPVEENPYEGEYIWVWGGPYDAHQELMGEFGGSVPDDVITELADELSAISPEWSGNPDAGAIDDYLTESPTTLPPDFIFRSNLYDVERLLKTVVDADVEKRFLQLLFASVITAVETYLADFFTITVMADPPLLRKCLETDPEFKNQKVALSEVFQVVADIQTTVKAHLLAIVWHNLARVREMFKSTLAIEFTISRELFSAVAIRHDIVHRNGKKKEGSDVVVTRQQIEQLIKAAILFVEEIKRKWQSARSGHAQDSAPPIEI